VIAGGTASSGATDAVYVLDTTTSKVRMLGRLPAPTAHAQAFALGGSVYVAGGVDASGNVTGAVTKIVAATRSIVTVPGALPVSDAGTVELSSSVLVIGGASAAGATGAVRRLVASARG
jgi:hypothetical protein